jgi:hypothetical protein
MRKNIFLICILLLSLILLYTKIIRLYGLHYFIDDFTNNLQGTFSWFSGRPLTYANGFGKMNTAHNYFLMPLLGLFTNKFGAIGAFIITQLLYVIAYWQFYLTFKTKAKSSFYIAFVFVLLSPTFFWIYDHPHVGWCVELLYLPLVVLYVLSLCQNSKWAVFWAVVLCLVREEGIILLAFSFVYYHISKNKYTSIKQIFSDKHIIKVVLSLIIVFAISFAWLILRAKNQSFIEDSGNIIIQEAKQATIYMVLLKIIVHKYLILLPTFLVVLLFLKPNLLQLKIILFFTFSITVILLVHTIRYYVHPHIFEKVSMHWAPRYILLHSIFAVFIIVNAFGGQEKTQPKVNLERKIYGNFFIKWPAFTLLLLWAVQWPIISYVRDDFSLKTYINSLFFGEKSAEYNISITAAEYQMFKKIEAAIPPKSNVYLFEQLMGLFHKHYFIFYKGVEYQKADIAILPNQKLEYYTKELPAKFSEKYQKVYSTAQFDLYATEKYKKYILQNTP